MTIVPLGWLRSDNMEPYMNKVLIACFAIVFATSALAQDRPAVPPQHSAEHAMQARVQSVIGSQALAIIDLQSKLEAAQAELEKLKAPKQEPKK